MSNLNSSDNKYISLKAAAELYGYTRDHLGLMIRRNKLKGVKLGSYYVTTNVWMSDYIKNFADSDHPASRNKLSNKFLTNILSSKVNFSPAANSGNAAKRSEKTFPKNARNNIAKPIVGAKDQVVIDDLGVKILEALAQTAPPSGNITPKAEIGRAENAISTFRHAPYVVLPIRRMENTEREEILRKTE